MSAQRKLDLSSNAPQELVLRGGMFGAQQIVLTFDENPGTGTATVEVMPVGGTQWVELTKAVDLDLTEAPYFIRSAGWINRVRVTFTGATGGVDGWLWAQQVELPPGLFEGLAAITIQNYIEANVKNGVQYEISSNTPSLANGANIDTIFTTGENPVIIKSRQIKFNGTSLVTRVYRDPVYTGGSVTPYFNLNDVDPVPGRVVIRAGATVSSPGVEFGAPTYDIGSDGTGNASISTFSVFGIERILAPYTTYLQRITNDSGSAQRVSGYLTWFDGSADFPL